MEMVVLGLDTNRLYRGVANRATVIGGSINIPYWKRLDQGA
jgi:hypothetical protein